MSRFLIRSSSVQHVASHRNGVLRDEVTRGLSLFMPRQLRRRYHTLPATTTQGDYEGVPVTLEATAIDDGGSDSRSSSIHANPRVLAADTVSPVADVPLTPRRVMNRRIKELNTVSDVTALVMSQATHMDSVNVGHAFIRLAKLYRASYGAGARNSRSSSSGPRLPNQTALLQRSLVLEPVQRLAEQLPRLVNEFDCWSVAACLWSLSVLNCYDKAVFDLLCGRGATLAATQMKPGDCNMIMLAFGRFGHYHPELLRCIPQVILKEIDQASACDISCVLWGFAKLGIPQAPGDVFMEVVSDNMMWTIDQYGCQELSTSLWAIATLGHRPDKGLLRASEAKLLETLPLLNTQDIGNSLWAFGKMHYKPVELLDELPLHIGTRLLDFKPQEISCILFCYTHSRHYHAALLDALAQVIVTRAPQMSQQDVVIAMWAFGIFGHRPCLTDLAPASAATVLNASTAVESVSNGLRSWQSGLQSSSRESRGDQASSSSAAESGGSWGGMSGENGDEADSERWASTKSASTSSASNQPPGILIFVEVLLTVINKRLRYLRPRGLANMVKALASLRVAAVPEVQAFVREVARIATARIDEFRPDELSNLLYGLSMLRCDELPIYHASVRHCMQLLEGQANLQTSWLNYKVLNSIIASCVSAGYTPWTLIESGEMRGMRLRNPTTYTQRWQQGHPPFGSSLAAKRRAAWVDSGTVAAVAQEHDDADHSTGKGQAGPGSWQMPYRAGIEKQEKVALP